MPDDLLSIVTPESLALTALKAGLKQAGKAVLAFTKRTDTNFVTVRDETFREWIAEVAWLISQVVARLGELERKEAERRFREDHQARATFANFVDDAFVEPDAERQRMIGHAAAGLVDVGLGVAEYTRLWRVVHELEPSDVLTLYRLRLVPSRALLPQDDERRGPLYHEDAFRFSIWESSGAEALLSAGCVRDYARAGAGVAALPMLKIQRTGDLVLRGLRSYLVSRKPIDLDEIPCHRTTVDFRSEQEARALIATFPGLYEAMLASRRAMYSAPNVPGGAPAPGHATLQVFAPMRDVDSLVRFAPERTVEHGAPVENLWVTRVAWTPGENHADDRDGVPVVVHGPHDVVRHLAYDLDARWV